MWPLQREPAAERQHRDLTERGDRLHRRLQPGLDVHEADARREHRRERSRAAGRARAASCPKPFTTRTPVTSSSTTLATSPAFCCASQLAGNTDVRSRIAVKSSAGATSEHHEREQRREDEHRAERHDEQQDVRHADRQELQEALDQRDVGRRAAHELTGLELVVAREVEPLQLPEHRGAQVVLHVERDAAAAVSAEVREHERQHAHDDHQREPRRERPASCFGVMTSSMMTFCTSGSSDWMSWPPIATPNAMYAFFLCGSM